MSLIEAPMFDQNTINMKLVIQKNLILLFVIMQFLLLSCSAPDNSIVNNDSASSLSDHSSFDEPSNQLGKHIFDIFEDSQGDLWFGTGEKGVARYDGKSLNYFTSEDGLCGKTVANIAEDKDGVLWFGTYSDMCQYDRNSIKNINTVSFTGFEKDKDGVPLLGYGWKKVRTDANGNLWVNSHHGMFQYINSQFKEFKVPGVDNSEASFCNTPGSISLDFIDSKGNFWFGTDHEGVYKYDGHTFSHFTKEDGLTSNSIMSIQEDRNGHIWFACRNGLNSNDKKEGGVCSYDGHVFTKYLDYIGLYDNNIHTLYSDKSKNLWIGATGTGVYKFDGETFTMYSEPDEVDYTDTFNTFGLQSMLEDSKGNLWMGFSGGLFRLEGDTIINVQQDGPWE